VEGNRRAPRNGPVSDPPPELPNVTIRNFYIAVRRLRATEAQRNLAERSVAPDSAIHQLTLTVDAGGPAQTARALQVAFCGFDGVPCGCGVQVP
jgi:hypothetical protein